MTPTIVLVHGAYADSTSWEGLLGLLPTDGRVIEIKSGLTGDETLAVLHGDDVFLGDGDRHLVDLAVAHDDLPRARLLA